MQKSQNQIEEALERLSTSKRPLAPANVEQNVWRRIREATAEIVDWRPVLWPRWLTNPAFGVGLFVVSGAIGAFPASIFVRQKSTAVDSRRAVSLSVFSERAPGMLHSNLRWME